MSWVDDAVGTFGREMGFARLRLPEQGAVELAFENRGTLALETGGRRPPALPAAGAAASGRRTASQGHGPLPLAT